MTPLGDRDGKSKTSSAADAEHYPDISRNDETPKETHPSHSEIAALAYHLWERRGGTDHSHDEDWLEAERQLTLNKEQNQVIKDQAGSVQR